MEKIALGELSAELEKKAEPVPSADMVEPQSAVTVEELIGWQGELGVMARLVESKADVADAIRRTGSVIERPNGETVFVFVYANKLYKSVSKVLTVQAPKLMAVLRRDARVWSVMVILKQARNGQRKYYDFEVG